MKRNPRLSMSHPRYADMSRWRPVVILSAVTLLGLGAGCPKDPQIAGDMRAPETGLEQLQLNLPAEGSHGLYFASPYASVSFHLEITVYSEAMALWFAGHEEEVLAVADELLGRHQAPELDPSTANLVALHPELIAAIEAMDGVGAGKLAALALVVDRYDDEVELSGDVAEPE
ncbi:MAG: hypothetical protein JXX28_11375 [Deltaproteobacteria bacterium]|nr:hypothetical protein [Deltaproteobacteria bacterium]